MLRVGLDPHPNPSPKGRGSLTPAQWSGVHRTLMDAPYRSQLSKPITQLSKMFTIV
jgi:hypothetical protein